jgi:hypothetical protein
VPFSIGWVIPRGKDPDRGGGVAVRERAGVGSDSFERAAAGDHHHLAGGSGSGARVLDEHLDRIVAERVEPDGLGRVTAPGRDERVQDLLHIDVGTRRQGVEHRRELGQQRLKRRRAGSGLPGVADRPPDDWHAANRLGQPSALVLRRSSRRQFRARRGPLGTNSRRNASSSPAKLRG